MKRLLITVILGVGLAFMANNTVRADEAADKAAAAVKAFIDGLKICTPTDEDSLLKILDINNATTKSCWSKDAAGKDQVRVILLDLSDVDNGSNTKKPLVIHLSKPLVLPDGATLIQYGDKIPPAQFIVNFPEKATPDYDCAITIKNRARIGALTDDKNNVTAAGTISLTPGVPTPDQVLHKKTAVCIKGSNNILVGLTIDKNDSSGFVNGIVIDGQSNILTAKITTISTGITINGPQNGVAGATITTGTAGIIINSGGDAIKKIQPNIVTGNTIHTNDGCLKDSAGKCTSYAPSEGGIIININNNLIANNTLKPGAPIFFSYDATQTPIVPVMPIEAAANVLKLNGLSKDDASASNYQELYLGLMGQKDLPYCPTDIKIGNVSYTYIYIQTSKGPVVACADGSSAKPICPALNVQNECACPGNLIMSATKQCGCAAGYIMSSSDLKTASCVLPETCLAPNTIKNDQCVANQASTPVKSCTGTYNIRQLDGSCGNSCGANQVQSNSLSQLICACATGYTAANNACIANKPLDLNASAVNAGGGGGNCSLNPNATTHYGAIIMILLIPLLLSIFAIRSRILTAMAITTMLLLGAQVSDAAVCTVTTHDELITAIGKSVKDCESSVFLGMRVIEIQNDITLTKELALPDNTRLTGKTIPGTQVKLIKGFNEKAQPFTVKLGNNSFLGNLDIQNPENMASTDSTVIVYVGGNNTSIARNTITGSATIGVMVGYIATWSNYNAVIQNNIAVHQGTALVVNGFNNIVIGNLVNSLTGSAIIGKNGILIMDWPQLSVSNNSLRWSADGFGILFSKNMYGATMPIGLAANIIINNSFPLTLSNPNNSLVASATNFAEVYGKPFSSLPICADKSTAPYYDDGVCRSPVVAKTCPPSQLLLPTGQCGCVEGTSLDTELKVCVKIVVKTVEKILETVSNPVSEKPIVPHDDNAAATNTDTSSSSTSTKDSASDSTVNPNPAGGCSLVPHASNPGQLNTILALLLLGMLAARACRSSKN